MPFKYKLDQEVNFKVLNSACIGSIKSCNFSLSLVNGSTVATTQYTVYVPKIQAFIMKVDESILDKLNPSNDECSPKLTLKPS